MENSDNADCSTLPGYFCKVAGFLGLNAGLVQSGDLCHCCTNALFSKLFWALVNDLPWLFIGVCSWCEAVQNRNEELLLPDFCSFEVGGFFRVEITRCTNEWVEWCVTQEKGNSRRVGTHYNLNNTNLTPLM